MKTITNLFSSIIIFAYISTPFHAAEVNIKSQPSLNGQVDPKILLDDEDNNYLDVIIELHQPSVLKQERSLKSSGPGKFQRRLKVAKNIEQTQASLVSSLNRHKLVHSTGSQFQLLFNGISARIDKDQIVNVTNLPDVKKVHISSEVKIHLSQSVSLIGADQVWNLRDNNNNNITGQGVTVAIIDTGIDYLHPDLGGCIGPQCKVLGGYDFVNGDDDPVDDHGHGTHVAGIVAANGHLRGVAPDARLYALKVCNQFGSCPTDGILAALEWAANPDGDITTDDAVDILNMSLGAPGPLDSPLSIATDEAVENGIVAVVSAGNRGYEGADGFSMIGTPANSRNAITVGSTNKVDLLAFDSSKGPLLTDSYQKPDLVAPGVAIYSLELNNEYDHKSGTSMAAPHVAGVAALLLQQDDSQSVEKIKSRIVSTTETLDGGYHLFGSGRLDALNSLSNNLHSDNPVLMFGKLDRSESTWSRTQRTSLTNEGNAALLVSATTTSNGTNINFSINGEKNFLIGAGETSIIEVSVEVDTESVSTTSSLLHEGTLTISSTSGDISIPLIIFDAVKVNWSSEDYLNWTWLHQTDGNHSHVERYSYDGETYIPVGHFGIISYIPSHDRDNFIFEDLGFVTEDIDINLISTKAQNRIQISELIDHHGNRFDSTNLYGGRGFVGFSFEDSKYYIAEFLDSSTDNLFLIDRPIYISDVPNTYEINLSVLFGDETSPLEDHHLYAYSSTLAGINNDLDITLDGTSQHQVIIENDLPQSLNYYNRWVLFTSLFPGEKREAVSVINGRGISGPEMDVPFTLNIHGNSHTNKHMAYQFEYGQNSTYHFRFDNEQGISTLRYSYNPAISFHFEPYVYSNLMNYPMKGEGTFASSYLNTDSRYNFASNVYGGHLLLNYQRFSGEDVFHILSVINCDMYALDGSNKSHFNLSVEQNFSDCSHLTLDNYYLNHLNGSSYLSKGSETDNYLVNLDTIYLNPLVSQEALSANSTSFVRYGFSTNNTENRRFTVELNYDGDWISIPFIETFEAENQAHNNSSHSVKYDLMFPDLERPRKTSIRLRLETAEGVNEQIITNAVLLGGTRTDLMQYDTDNDGLSDAEDLDNDNDGIPDDIEIVNEMNFLDPTDAHGDVDGDGVSNIDEYLTDRLISHIEVDTDNDSVFNHLDEFPLDPMESLDSDNDGIGNNADTDDDNDGVDDSEDAFPLDPSESMDSDNDGIGNNADTDDDNDGVDDSEDAFPLDPSESMDSDNDGIGNNADTDDDNDGVDDSNDAFPLDPSESIDTDNDGVGNNADTDDDGDGVNDTDDVFPLDPSESLDSDNDGIGNNADADDDNDGVNDTEDAFPLDASESHDTDGDGTGNNADTDDDNDGVDDSEDDFPLDASESLDTDGDGTGNNADSDDDNDGVNDTEDAFPLDASESLDTDGDGTGNNADTDDDNDGVNDTEDAFPLDASESLDTDGDGIGNNADTDDDGDGVPDASDYAPLDASISQAPRPTAEPNQSGGGGSIGYMTLYFAFMVLIKMLLAGISVSRRKQ